MSRSIGFTLCVAFACSLTVASKTAYVAKTNPDHSTLNALTIGGIIAGKTDKIGLCEVNRETDCHEKRGSSE